VAISEAQIINIRNQLDNADNKGHVYYIEKRSGQFYMSLLHDVEREDIQSICEEVLRLREIAKLSRERLGPAGYRMLDEV
jgi:hypothetical protein